MYIYAVSKSDFFLPGVGRYISFGIVIYRKEYGRKVKITTVNDVTTDYKQIRTVVDKCNVNQLDPIHMNDVIYDIIV